VYNKAYRTESDKKEEELRHLKFTVERLLERVERLERLVARQKNG